MKLLTAPTIKVHEVRIPFGDTRTFTKKLLRRYDPDRDAIGFTTFAGRMTSEKFLIEDDDNIEMYQKIEEITLEHNGKFYRIFGLLPLNKNPNGIQCICDYYDDGDKVKFTSQDGVATITVQ